MEDDKEDIRKKYPSLPPNYVSLAQLQERWIQQKQKEAEQKEQIASDNRQQPKEKENSRFNGSPQSSKKNGVGRNHTQGSHVRRNGELRVDANMVYVPRRQPDENHGQIREANSKSKSKKSRFRASGDSGGSGMGNAKNKNDNHKKKRRPRVKEGPTGEDLAQTLSGNGEISGVLIGKNGGKKEYPGYENKRVDEIVNTCTVGLAPENKGKEGNPVGFSGKQLVDDQFSSSGDSGTLDAKSRGKQVVDNPFSNSTDSERVETNSLQKHVVDDGNWTVEAKSCGKHLVNGQFFCSTNDRRLEANYHRQEAINGHFLSNTGVEGSVNECKVEVPPKNGSEDEVSAGLRRKNNRRYNTEYERYKKGGNDKGLLGEGNVCMQEALQDYEEEEEVSLDERSKSGKERLGSRFQGNKGNWRMNRSSNERESKLGQQLVGEDVFRGKKERTGPEARTGKGARAYGNKDRVYDWIGRDFGDLSFHDSRKGNSSRGYRRRYGNFGSSLHRKEKQGGLVWVKKEEKSDTNAEIS